MVTARLAIGSVSTLALGALVLGSAPYWLHRGGSGSHASPWGVVSALGAAQSAATQSEDERAQLLKLAALKSGAAPEPASVATAQAAAPSPIAEPAPAPVTAPAQAIAAPVQSAATDTTASAVQPPVMPAAAPPAEASQQLASAEVPAGSDIAQDDGAAKSDRININTASPSALDHLPGAGRIGRTIVSHRPYKSVKDLVSRRVLRTSDFQKIQSHISVD